MKIIKWASLSGVLLISACGVSQNEVNSANYGSKPIDNDAKVIGMLKESLKDPDSLKVISITTPARGFSKEGANKRGNSSRLTQSFHFFMFEPIFSPVNALNQPI
ncbi:TPA: hypothetical protein QHC20_005734 [Raoultella ornithinolytica]|nr:hypothetical protein [Raoultella ornithinolytica]